MPPSTVHFNGSVNLPDAETVMREISSRVPSGVRRMTDGETGERGYWIHFQVQKFLAMPVPQARDDAAYFAPLRDLESGPQTELCLALVPYHPDDQAPGTTSRQMQHIDAALAQSAAGAREWGICTECGMGRVAAGDVPKLLDLHREILANS
jgi:hypothetical protein